MDYFLNVILLIYKITGKGLFFNFLFSVFYYILVNILDIYREL